MKPMFSDILKRLREDQGLSQQDLAIALNIGRSAVGNYEQGKRNPDMETLEKIADFFNVDMDYLYGKTSIKNKYQLSTSSPTAIKDGIASANPLRIPVVGEIAGGTPIEAIYNQIDPDDPNTWEEIPSEWTRSGKVFFALKVEGDSMEPDIPDGTIAIIEQTYAWHNNHVMAVYVNGYNATLKKVKIESNGILSLIPFNHQHETRIFTPEEIENLPVRPLGKLIETRIKW